MAKKKAGGNPGLLALRKRYKAQSNKILKIYKTEYETNIRAYRHEISVAKKAGLIDKSIDARKAVPTPALSRALGRAEYVLQGNAKTQKVSKKLAAQLRDEGHEVYRDRAIISKDARINKRGEIVKGKGDNARVFAKLKAGADIDSRVADIMQNMRDGEYLSVALPGTNYSQYFGKGEYQDFLATIYKYLYFDNGKSRMKYLYIEKFANEEAAAENEESRIGFMLERKEKHKSAAKKKRRSKPKPPPEKRRVSKPRKVE